MYLSGTSLAPSTRCSEGDRLQIPSGLMLAAMAPPSGKPDGEHTEAPKAPPSGKPDSEHTEAPPETTE